MLRRSYVKKIRGTEDSCTMRSEEGAEVLLIFLTPTPINTLLAFPWWSSSRPPRECLPGEGSSLTLAFLDQKTRQAAPSTCRVPRHCNVGTAPGSIPERTLEHVHYR
jgi:hypothetical protein